MKLNTWIAIFSVSLFSFSAGMAQESKEKLVILGSGPAGLTSAIYAGQLKLSPLVIEGSECEGQLASVYHMENYPGFPEGINGRELVERMKLQAQKFGARFQSGPVVAIDLINRPFTLTFEDGRTVQTESIIIALGTKKKWLGIPSEEFFKENGVHASATCDGHLFQEKAVVVLGGGDTACEEALALTEYATKVTLIYHRNAIYASPYLQERIFANKKIEVICDSNVEEILDVTQGSVTGVVLRNLKTKETKNLSCQGVFVAIGRVPNTEMFKGQLELTTAGLIAIEANKTQTSISGVFAAGDVSDPTYRKAITASGMGCMAAIDAAKFLSKP